MEIVMTPSAQVQLLTFKDVPKEVFTRWDITEHQMNQHLLAKSLSGTPEIVADVLTFPPGFIHHMHRHPHADMIVVPLAGNLQFVGDFDGTEELEPGQLLVVPRDNWHEFRNVSDASSEVLHIFSGVGAVEDIGYEPHPNQFSITH
jgi:quercetin dioxygenase-like cupin family protein